MNYMLVFESHNQAILLFNKLIKSGYKVELISTPCDLSVGCSQSLKFNERDMSLIINEAKKNLVRINAIYLLKKDGRKTEYLKVKWAEQSGHFYFYILNKRNILYNKP